MALHCRQMRLYPELGARWCLSKQPSSFSVRQTRQRRRAPQLCCWRRQLRCDIAFSLGAGVYSLSERAGKASAHRTNPQIASQWAEARFNCLTNFVHDEEEDSITINKDNFDDPLQAGIFDYIASGKSLGSKSHSMNKNQFMEAMSKIAKYNEEGMAQFIVEAMLFIYNRTNRLHPDTVDANTIASLMNDVQNNYPEVLLRDGKVSCFLF